jgi:branched-chain amino acid transport system ATP-binding protein
MALLEIHDLHVHYGVIEALKGVSIKVEPGQIVTLIGANGAGKTTLLQAISGIVKKTSGEIEFEGGDITKANPKNIVGKGLVQVPEGRHVFPGLTVYENLMMGAYLRKDKKGIQEDLKKVYERFPILEKRKKQDAATLSGGEQQMLAMGRALMAKPSMILLDEPSMGLAPILVKEIFSIIEDINEAGTTVLLVEQNARMALSIADYGYVLETGNVVLEGPAQELAQSEAVQNAYLGGSAK